MDALIADRRKLTGHKQNTAFGAASIRTLNNGGNRAQPFRLYSADFPQLSGQPDVESDRKGAHLVLTVKTDEEVMS